MLLGLSALGVGFFTDDYPFIAHLEDSGPQRGSPWGLYEFASGDEHANFELVKRGPYPWWTAPESEAPLSASALERALRSQSRVVWAPPIRVPPAHLSLVRRVAVCGGAASALRARASALGHEHARLCAGAIACRAAGVDIRAGICLSPTTPALLGLAAHVHRREHLEGRLARLAWGGWLAPAGLVLGLFGGEAAISVAVYWLAYEAFGAPEAGERRARLRNLAVPFVILVAYLLTYKALGYGVRHSEAYVDAMESPITFASTVFWRLPLLFGELLLGVPAALAYNVFPKIGALVGLLGGVLVAVLLRTVWSELSLSSRRAVRWLVSGAFLSMSIGLGGIPGARLVVIPGIGASVVLGAILTHGWRRWSTSRWPARSAGRAGVALLVVIHLVLAPLTFLASVQSIATLGKKTAEIDASLDGLLNERHTLVKGPLQVIILSASDPLAGIYVAASPSASWSARKPPSIAGRPASARFTTVVGTPSSSSCLRMPSTHGEPSVRTSTRRSILGGSATSIDRGHQRRHRRDQDEQRGRAAV